MSVKFIRAIGIDDGDYLRNSLERRNQKMEPTLPQDALESWVELLQAIRTYRGSVLCSGNWQCVTGWHTGKVPKVLDREVSLSVVVQGPSMVGAGVGKATLFDGEFILALNWTSVEYKERRAIVCLPLVQVSLDVVLESEGASCSRHQRFGRVVEDEAEVVGCVDSNHVLLQLRGLVRHSESVDEGIIVLDWMFVTN